MRKLILLALLILFYIPTNALAGFIAVEKITDMYCLRENGELVKFRDTENNIQTRIAVNVVDFNNSVYITEDGGLYTMLGEKLASDAKKTVPRAIYTDGKYNGEYAYISHNNTLVLPAVDGYSERRIISGVLKSYANIVIKEDGTASALIWESGAVTEKELVKNSETITGEEGEYLIIDSDKTCWFVPIEKGEFIYDYETVKLEENITYCSGTIDGLVSGTDWSEYDRRALATGNVVKSTKGTDVIFAYGDHIFIDKNRTFGSWYNGKMNTLVSNVREAYQHQKGSMNGYFLDQSDILYRNEQDGNHLTSTEVASPMYNIKIAGDGWCIAATQDGVYYGIDKAVSFGTGKIEEGTGVVFTELPLTQKTVYLYVNGEKVTLTRRIIERDGRTLYPLREMCELLGAEVTWDDSSKTAQATLNNNTVKFKVGEGAYELNGIRKNMDAVTIIDNLTQSTYIPLRYMAEALGFEVKWTGAHTENIITVTKAV